MVAEERIHREVGERLDAAGQLYTRGRKAIVDALAKAGRPVSLPMLLAATSGVTQSSAYRNLALMEEAGVVRRLLHGTEHACYELAEDLTGHHHHLICSQCGAVRDFVLSTSIERSLAAAFELAAGAERFVVTNHAVDVFGTCAACVSTR